jgi:hypothetical protein
MRTKDGWTEILNQKAQELEFNDGFHLLYCPWKTISNANVAFISLNPGRALPANMYLTSDERGNSYEVEEYVTLSPITKQFLIMCRRFGIKPSQVLTGTAAPFRSGHWNHLSSTQRKGSLAVGHQFWTEAVQHTESPIKLFITVSAEAKNLALALTCAKEEKIVQSGWANTKLIRYRNDHGQYVVSLPHLSRYQLFSRDECNGPLASIFADVSEPI